MRGKPYVYSSVNKSFRITPADAGKTINPKCNALIK